MGARKAVCPASPRSDARLLSAAGLLAIRDASGLNRNVRFSIITPSLNQSAMLRCCIASIADQGVEVEHLIQDANSTDGTLDWVLGDARVKAQVESDHGMYDGVNRGFTRAQGDVLAWLNCDEQYLPGALMAVADFFGSHPEIDMVFGDIVLVDAAGRYLCHRRVQPPLLYHTWVCHLSTLSCAMFFRKAILEQSNLRLDTTYQCGGDGEWMVRLLRSGVRMAALGRFTSVFTLHDSNLSQSRAAKDEWKRLRDTAPWWVRGLSPIWVLHHRLRRLIGGSYQQSPFKFSTYATGNPKERIEQNVIRPRIRCPHKI